VIKSNETSNGQIAPTVKNKTWAPKAAHLTALKKLSLTIRSTDLVRSIDFKDRSTLK
jgi:hypothetical protein